MEALELKNLRLFLKIITFRIWAKRVRMVAFRILLVALFTYFILTIITDPNADRGFGGTIHLNLAFIVGVLFMLFWFTRIWTTMAWQQFAFDNNFHIQDDLTYRKQYRASSFLRKTRFTYKPIAIPRPDGPLLLQAQLYREGGILTWREFKLDMAVRINLPAGSNVPQVLADATPQDKHKLTNLRKRTEGLEVFRAEGEAGTHYRLLTRPQHSTDALTIFTPDVLVATLDNIPGTDIEFDGTVLWFVYRNMPRRVEAIQQWLMGIEKVMPEIRKQLHSYQTGRKTV